MSIARKGSVCIGILYQLKDISSEESFSLTSLEFGNLDFMYQFSYTNFVLVSLHDYQEVGVSASG